MLSGVRSRLSGAVWKEALAWGVVLPVLLLPVANPDLFWHLLAGESIAAHGLPRDDLWSFTLLGAPWVDFEWLVQLIYFGIHAAAGWPGLWALKILLLILAGLCVRSLADLHGAQPPARNAAILFWACLMAAWSELKPELFSIILFTCELWALEALRLGRLPAKPGLWAAGSLLFFAFWANLHPGFAAGLALFAVYSACAGERRAACGAALAAGIAGTFLNPYGWGVHKVLIEHYQWLPAMGRHIAEWRPLTFENPYHWAHFALIAVVGIAFVVRSRRAERSPAPHFAAAGLFGLAGWLHARQVVYFIPVGLLILLETSARPGDSSPDSEAGRWRAGGFLWAAVCAAYVGFLTIPHLRPLKALDERPFPVEACSFVERHMDLLGRRRIYNEWGWGGYLARRLGPRVRVFMDGRYLFHRKLLETAGAQADPQVWQAFLDNHGVEWAMVLNRPRKMEVLVAKDLKDKNPRKTELPHFELYMPRLRWALVHRDPLALVYVRRGTVPKSWLGRWELDGRAPVPAPARCRPGTRRKIAPAG